MTFSLGTEQAISLHNDSFNINCVKKMYFPTMSSPIILCALKNLFDLFDPRHLAEAKKVK